MVTRFDPIAQALERLRTSTVDTLVATTIRERLEGHGPIGAEADAALSPGYLRSVTVSGFRGIGPETTLAVEPGPGLTLVVGRNGSGKSSLADALEFLLTGDAMRWAGRTADWKKGWRNLHDSDTASIRAEFLVEDGPNPLTLTHEWDDGAGLGSSTGTAQAHGRPQVPLQEFEWTEAAITARPFLSYSELGHMLEQGPSRLYDAMSRILGLDSLIDAAEDIRQDRLARQKEIKAVKEELDARVLPRLEGLEDPRAVRCRTALEARTWDLDTVAGILGGDLGSDSSREVHLLRETAAVGVTPLGDVEARAGEVHTAVSACDALAGTDAHRAAAAADLLKRALRFHRDHEGSDCPVCCTAGILDEAWREQAAASMHELEEQAKAVRAADARLADAYKAFRSAARPGAFHLVALEPLGIDTGSVAAAIDALAATLEGPDEPSTVDDVTEQYAAYATAVASLQEAAEAEATRRDDEWRPVALELSGWLAQGRHAQAHEAAVPDLHKAEKWIRRVTGDIRTERFEPIAARAQEVWSQLSLHSNVELRDLVLAGTTSNRKLEIDVTVDGVEGVALGVMSQGELHGLALSLFLPRATLDESPFRFVVIDDPVQAMDPSRVDGLARVLHEVAADRQVIVFTHDDRLPEAVRRLRIPATIFEVTRRPGSIVELHKSLDPTHQALEDARALARSDGVPEPALRRLVPGLCRTGLEAAATSVVRRRRLAAGASHTEVERDLSQANRLTHYLALALFDDMARGGDVLPRLNTYGRWAGDVYKACNRGIHDGHGGDLMKLVGDATSLAGRIEELT